MKKLTMTALATVALLLTTTSEIRAQEKEAGTTPGSWQLVSTVAQPKTVNVQFYNAGGVLMYEERIEGRKLNTARRKVCRRLDAALATAYHAWTKNETASMEGRNLLARRSKGKGGSCTASASQ